MDDDVECLDVGMCVFFWKFFINKKYFVGNSHRESLKNLSGLKIMKTKKCYINFRAVA